MEELENEVVATLKQLANEGVHLPKWATDTSYVDSVCENYKDFVRYYGDLCNKYSEAIPRFAEKGQFLYNYLKEFWFCPTENPERLVDHWVTGEFTRYFNNYPAMGISNKLICFKGELFTISNLEKVKKYYNDPDRYMTEEERKYYEISKKWNMEELW